MVVAAHKLYSAANFIYPLGRRPFPLSRFAAGVPLGSLFISLDVSHSPAALYIHFMASFMGPGRAWPKRRSMASLVTSQVRPDFRRSPSCMRAAAWPAPAAALRTALLSRFQIRAASMVEKTRSRGFKGNFSDFSFR